MASGGASPLNLATVCLPAKAAFAYGASAGMMLGKRTSRTVWLFQWSIEQEAVSNRTQRPTQCDT